MKRDHRDDLQIDPHSLGMSIDRLGDTDQRVEGRHRPTCEEVLGKENVQLKEWISVETQNFSPKSSNFRTVCRHKNSSQENCINKPHSKLTL